jgi:Zn-dependent M32 family carboxypeptidase
MDDCEWIYTGHSSQTEFSEKWIEKTNAFLELAFARLKERVPLGVPAADVQTCIDKQRRTWVNIFASMDLWQTIPDGSTMVKLIV